MTKNNGAACQASASDAPSRPTRRKTDTENYSKFRPSRFVKSDGKWYFATREGTMEGPYEKRREAEHKLDSYINVMLSGFASLDSQLSIHPLEEPVLYESSPLS